MKGSTWKVKKGFFNQFIHIDMAHVEIYRVSRIHSLSPNRVKLICIIFLLLRDDTTIEDSLVTIKFKRSLLFQKWKKKTGTTSIGKNKFRYNSTRTKKLQQGCENCIKIIKAKKPHIVTPLKYMCSWNKDIGTRILQNFFCGITR